MHHEKNRNKQSVNKHCQQNKQAGQASPPCQGSWVKLCSSLWWRCARRGESSGIERWSDGSSSIFSPSAAPQNRCCGAGETARCQHCHAAILCYGCPAARFSLLPGHLGNSLKKSSSGSGGFKDGDIFCSLVFVGALCAPSFW